MARRPRRPTLRAPEPIGGLVGRVECGGGPAARTGVSRADWEAAVGARIADRAEPVELDRGLLVVRVATSVWASELSLLSIPIVARLRDRGLEVHALRCRVGPVTPRRDPPALRPARAVPPPRPLPAALAEELLTVPDEELRASIASAARANLAWQSYVAVSAPAANPPGPPDGDSGSTTAASRAARVPRSAGRESDRPDRSSGGSPGGPPRKP